VKLARTIGLVAWTLEVPTSRPSRTATRAVRDSTACVVCFGGRGTPGREGVRDSAILRLL
jgi:hypothetical protein